MKRIGFAFILSLLMSASAFCQTGPAWPNIGLSGCPKISPPKLLDQRIWKHGEAEQDDAHVISKVQDRRQAAELLITFAGKYPDSDYREVSLLLAMQIGADLKDISLQARAAKVLVDTQAGEATALVPGFVTLDAALSPFVFNNDPEKTRKLADLETWTRCGREALAAQVRPDNTAPEAYEKSRRASESVLARTAGFIALQRQDYTSAGRELKKAASDNPQDALTFLWLGTKELGGDNQDLNAGLFYWARAEQLSPQIPQFSSFLKQLYVTVHGSEKGIDKLQEIARSNTTPPAGFNILPKQKKERHYGSAVAASAIVGLLVYGALKHPDFMMALGQGLNGGESNASGTAGQGKLMIFGGTNHETYLGCLNCAQAAPDSISNEYGQNGSRYSQTSIWNHYSQFGSPYAPYSACNPYSTDPPVIVDDAGTYYGRLTLNQFHPELGAGRQPINWLKQVVCAE
jgi:hypothetical protein